MQRQELPDQRSFYERRFRAGSIMVVLYLLTADGHLKLEGGGMHWQKAQARGDNYADLL